MATERQNPDNTAHPSPVSGLRLAIKLLDATAPAKAPPPKPSLPPGEMILDEAIRMVGSIVDGLGAGLFPILGIEEESTHWQQCRRRALTLLDEDFETPSSV